MQIPSKKVVYFTIHGWENPVGIKLEMEQIYGVASSRKDISRSKYYKEWANNPSTSANQIKFQPMHPIIYF